MTGLSKKKQNFIVVNNSEVEIIDNFRNCLIARDLIQEAYEQKRDSVEAILMIFYYLCGIDPDDWDDELDVEYCMAFIKAFSEYFEKHAKATEFEKQDGKPTIIDWELDEVLIRDAYRLLGKDLLEIENYSLPAFLADFRLLQSVDAPYCRLLYIRTLHRDGRLYKKEYKSELKEAKEVWTMNLVKLVDKAKIKEQQDHEDAYLTIVNKMRIAEGLEPLTQ